MPPRTRSGKTSEESTKLPKSTVNRKSPKKTKVNKGTANGAIKRIVNQHESIKYLIKKQLNQRVLGEARLSWLVENKEELYKQGESNVKKFFSKWLKGGDTLAQYFLHAEGMRLYEKVENLKLTVEKETQHKYMLDHLKYKYKHLRRAHEFWQTFANTPLAKKNIEKFSLFKTAIQYGIDSYFDNRTKVYEPEAEE